MISITKSITSPIIPNQTEASTAKGQSRTPIITQHMGQPTALAATFPEQHPREVQIGEKHMVPPKKHIIMLVSDPPQQQP